MKLRWLRGSFAYALTVEGAAAAASFVVLCFRCEMLLELERQRFMGSGSVSVLVSKRL